MKKSYLTIFTLIFLALLEAGCATNQVTTAPVPVYGTKPFVLMQKLLLDKPDTAYAKVILVGVEEPTLENDDSIKKLLQAGWKTPNKEEERYEIGLIGQVLFHQDGHITVTCSVPGGAQYHILEDRVEVTSFDRATLPYVVDAVFERQFSNTIRILSEYMKK